MSDSSNNNSGGAGVLGLLGVLFVGLKLTGFINWSWWLVTIPFWGGFALIIGIVLVFLTCSALLYSLVGVVKYFEFLINYIKGSK